MAASTATLTLSPQSGGNNTPVIVLGQQGVVATLLVTNGVNVATTVQNIFRTSTPAASGPLASDMLSQVVNGFVPASGASIGYGNGIAQFKWVDQYDANGPAGGTAFVTTLRVVLATGEEITPTIATNGTVTVDVLPNDPTGF